MCEVAWQQSNIDVDRVRIQKLTHVDAFRVHQGSFSEYEIPRWWTTYWKPCSQHTNASGGTIRKKRGLSVGCWNENGTQKTSLNMYTSLFPISCCEVLRSGFFLCASKYQEHRLILTSSGKCNAKTWNAIGCLVAGGCSFPLYEYVSWPAVGDEGPTKPTCLVRWTPWHPWYWHGIRRIAWKHAPSANYKRTKRNQ